MIFQLALHQSPLEAMYHDHSLCWVLLPYLCSLRVLLYIFHYIIFGSLRFIADLPFSECGDFFSKNTPGIFFKGCCPFIPLYWLFVLPTSQIYLHFSEYI